LTADKKGIIESLSWKASLSAIAAALALYFGIPEYVHSTRPFLVTNMGLELVCFLEGAITGAATFFVVLKLYSQLSSKKETAKTVTQAPDPRQVRKRIRQELQILGNQIRVDQQSQNFQGRTYGIDAFQNLQQHLILALDNEAFREIKEAYEKISELQYTSNLGDINARKCQEALAAIDRAIKRLS
jgi:hypothetical protein